jgi:uncharacterized cupin superfamily protein
VEVFNLYDGELDVERAEPEGFRWRAARLGEKLGATLLGATLYELEPGERTFPYHYEWGCEEWLIVVAGTPTLRAPEGERELAPGDTVCFPEGPTGAHLISNGSDGVVRVLILSNKARPAIAVYPDSDKIGIWVDGEDSALFRRSTQVDYWDGELNSPKGA